MAARTSKKYAILALKDMLSDLEGTWTDSLYELHAKWMSYMGHAPLEISLGTSTLEDEEVLANMYNMAWDIYNNWSDNDQDGKFYKTLEELHMKISSIVDNPNNALFDVFKGQLEEVFQPRRKVDWQASLEDDDSDDDDMDVEAPDML